jgi:hypothetical protein
MAAEMLTCASSVMYSAPPPSPLVAAKSSKYTVFAEKVVFVINTLLLAIKMAPPICVASLAKKVVRDIATAALSP